MTKDLVHRVQQRFLKTHGEMPLMISSPGRINLIGEHTDYNLGFVFPAAIDKGIVCAIGKSDTARCSAHAMDFDEIHEFSLEGLKALKNGQWRNYIIGVVAEMQKLDLPIEPFHVVFGGDIPKGAGLSSSAALENSIVFGLNDLFNCGLSKMEMIHISQRAEHHYVGVKCGIMDQYASMFGEEDSALLIDCDSLEAKTIAVTFESYEVVLINSNVSHSLVDAAYNDRRQVCEKVADLLHIKALRFATETDLLSIRAKISETEYQKALYVIQENERVLKAYACLRNGDVEGFGELLFSAHEGASKQFKISCPELDHLVQFSKAHPSAIGARMMGGGFGGCTINLVKKEQVQAFQEDISADYFSQFQKHCSIYRTKLSKGTHIIS